MGPSLRDHIEREKQFSKEYERLLPIPEVKAALREAGLPSAFIDRIRFESYIAIANPTTVLERRESIYRLTVHLPTGPMPAGWTDHKLRTMIRANLPAEFRSYELFGL